MSKINQDHVRYEVITQEDPVTGDLMLPIPQVLLDKLGWKEGDNIEFGLDDNGHYILKRAE
jgi:hypothetical protein